MIRLILKKRFTYVDSICQALALLHIIDGRYDLAIIAVVCGLSFDLSLRLVKKP